MAEIKTKPTGADVTAFLDAVPDETRRRDGHSMRALMERITGEPAVMWGPTMVGFGSKPYTNTTGTNEMFILGFSPRKADLTLYGLTNAYEEPDPLLDELGPHRLGKSCLYVKRLENVNAEVLERLVHQAWERRS
ncbi:hypothetical protein HDC94_000579 [Leifsonia sp. AK011]|uniref:DUF1801 domain-containing protein n=1 Tax=Leifsonia sp. AK011 TaxID=2723075 RepID=UPI0015CC8386|nr:DUF1801 domain-containing protein [Leifsonia sp. AK011]NYF09423.1 hypothetical protein [Leifsonia sp. AK011]